MSGVKYPQLFPPLYGGDVSVSCGVTGPLMIKYANTAQHKNIKYLANRKWCYFSHYCDSQQHKQNI